MVINIRTGHGWQREPEAPAKKLRATYRSRYSTARASRDRHTSLQVVHMSFTSSSKSRASMEGSQLRSTALDSTGPLASGPWLASQRKRMAAVMALSRLGACRNASNLRRTSPVYNPD